MKKRKIMFVIILLVTIFGLSSILYFNSKNKNLKNTDKKISEKNIINQAKKKNSKNENTIKDQTIENEETSSKNQDESQKDSLNKNSSKQESNSSNQVSNNTSQTTTTTSATTDQKQTTSQQVQTPPRVQTEWERLGISEYDYYNTPAHNEGEIAFYGDISLCIGEKNRLTDLYYDKGINGGREYTVNGEYTHSYLGCGLYIIMNGKSYKYSEIIAMEKQGFFN